MILSFGTESMHLAIDFTRLGIGIGLFANNSLVSWTIYQYQARDIMAWVEDGMLFVTVNGTTFKVEAKRLA